MKNFICFIIILLFAGFVFFTGWTQIKVKPSNIGVVQSKISGISDDLVIPGNFSWHKEFLIPTNAVLNQFEYKPFNTEKTISGKRTSYNNPDSLENVLDYSFTYKISLSYTPEVILDLLKENTISNQGDFETYLEGVCAYLSQRATDYYLIKYRDDYLFNPESVKFEELLNAISFYKEYPQFDINFFAISDYKLPYYSVYDSL